MSPRTEEQLNEIREATRARIMDESIKLFANNGYFPTSISLIAKNAKISKGLMYNYFDSKEDLLKQVIFKGFEEILKPVDFKPDEVLTKDKLINFIHSMFSLVKDNHNHWKLYFSVLLQPTVYKLVEKKLYEMAMPFFEILGNYFYLQGRKNPEAEARMFVAMLDGITLNYIMDSENFPMDAVEKKLIDFYIK
ncbi:MAG: TetR/AcrR family transcriptional regulator [Bacteroidales bacterium]|jgi:AcrR family transcriptional regulator|nr:TetR/AcrR family transcriptional regulator [Bacteroidales bacterium]